MADKIVNLLMFGYDSVYCFVSGNEKVCMQKRPQKTPNININRGV